MIKTLAILLMTTITLYGQSITYSSLNAHSHNDYLNKRPFWNAYEHQFGSIEADIHARGDSLYVAHSEEEIDVTKTLQKLYLQPIAAICQKKEGAIYEDKAARLVLLIDLKTAYRPTLTALIKALDPYRDYLYPKGKVQVIVSGNTPPPNLFRLYPNFIFFDGRPTIAYTSEQLRRVGMISQSFKHYSNWKGEGEMDPADKTRLAEVISQVQKLDKPFRLWATPDTPEAWASLMSLNLNYINTDQIEGLARFLAK